MFYEEVYGNSSRQFSFNVDNSEPNIRQPVIIHAPSDEAWDAEVPDWARGRRAEIVQRMRLGGAKAW